MNRILLLFSAICLAVTVSSAQVTFTDQTDLLTSEVYGTHATGVVDVNGDGLDDIVALDDGNDLFIWYQNDMGEFDEVNLGAIGDGGGWGGDWAWGMCLADVDNNGVCDLLAGGSYDDLKLCKLNSEGSAMEVNITPGPEIFLQGVNFFDIDYDGYADIFACHDDGPSSILLNDGTGVFVYDEEALAEIFDTHLYGGGEDDSGNYGSVFSDVNGDNYTDLYIAKCRQGVTDNTDVRRINQLWVYDPITESYNEEAGDRGLASGAQSWSADFGDIDNDGDMDVFIGNHDVASELLLNDGNGNFTDITEAAGLDASSFPFAVIQSIFRDFDNDGWIDLLVTGGGWYSLAYNNGDNTFTIENEAIEYSINSFAVGDLNSDGFVDIYAVAGGYGSWGDDEPDALLFNDGNDNHWLEVELFGSVSNVNAIGAKVVIEGSFGTMVREVRSGESYGIMNSLKLHFGLGEEESVDNVWVYWPSGIVDLISDVDSDQVLEIEEGSAVDIIDEESVEVQVYPNPASDQINITIDQDITDCRVVVTDQAGKLVIDQNLYHSSNRIDISRVIAGLYNVSIWSGDDVVSSKQIVVE